MPRSVEHRPRRRLRLRGRERERDPGLGDRAQRVDDPRVRGREGVAAAEVVLAVDLEGALRLLGVEPGEVAERVHDRRADPLEHLRGRRNRQTHLLVGVRERIRDAGRRVDDRAVEVEEHRGVGQVRAVHGPPSLRPREYGLLSDFRPIECRSAYSRGSEQTRVAGLEAAHRVVVEQQASDAAVGRERARLRLDLLRREDAGHGARCGSRFMSSRYRVSCSTPSTSPRRLISTATACAVGVAREDVDRSDRGHVLPSHQRVPVAEQLDLLGEQALQVGLDAVLLQARDRRRARGSSRAGSRGSRSPAGRRSSRG